MSISLGFLFQLDGQVSELKCVGFVEIGRWDLSFIQLSDGVPIESTFCFESQATVPGIVGSVCLNGFILSYSSSSQRLGLECFLYCLFDSFGAWSFKRFSQYRSNKASKKKAQPKVTDSFLKLNASAKKGVAIAATPMRIKRTLGRHCAYCCNCRGVIFQWLGINAVLGRLGQICFLNLYKKTSIVSPTTGYVSTAMDNNKSFDSIHQHADRAMIALSKSLGAIKSLSACAKVVGLARKSLNLSLNLRIAPPPFKANDRINRYSTNIICMPLVIEIFEIRCFVNDRPLLEGLA